MDNIKYYKEDLDIRDPVMIAGWPGMGNVAVEVVDYLQRKLGAVKCAQIMIDQWMAIDSVVVEEGKAALPPAPQNIFYYSKNPDMIIFESEAQLPGKGGIELLNQVLDVAEKYGVKRIYTGAAFPISVSYKESSQVYGAATNSSLLNAMINNGVRPMESGHISGLNGLLVGIAEKRGIEAACLLATMPQYAISLPNPKASSAILETLEKMMNFSVDINELSEYIKEMDDRMSIIEDKVKGVLAFDKDDNDAPHPAVSRSADKKIPAYIMDKIEKLFTEAKEDKSKAIILKRELDRWDLYKLYEDRFLDLFKNSQ